MTLKNLKIITGILLAVIANGFIGRFFPPSGLYLTPVIIIVASVMLTNRTDNLRPLYRSLLIYFFVALNDISIKLYSGGCHDYEGLGWVHLFLFMGLLPAYIILLVGIIADKKYRVIEKVLAVSIFPILIAIHLYFLSDIGLGRCY